MVEVSETSVTKGVTTGITAEQNKDLATGLIRRLYSLSQKDKGLDRDISSNMTKIPDNTEIVVADELAQVLALKILEEHKLRQEKGNKHPIVVAMGGRRFCR